MTPFREQVLRCIRHGTKERPISSEAIAAVLGTTANSVRVTLHRMRADGAHVECRGGPGGGYWMTQEAFIALQPAGQDMRVVPL